MPQRSRTKERIVIQQRFSGHIRTSTPCSIRDREPVGGDEKPRASAGERRVPEAAPGAGRDVGPVGPRPHPDPAAVESRSCLARARDRSAEQASAMPEIGENASITRKRRIWIPINRTDFSVETYGPFRLIRPCDRDPGRRAQKNEGPDKPGLSGASFCLLAERARSPIRYNALGRILNVDSVRQSNRR